MGAVFFVFLLGVGGVFFIYYALTQLPERLARRKLQGRIDEITLGIDPNADVASLIKGVAAGPLPGLDRLIGQTTRGLSLARWIEQSGAKATASGIVVIAGALAIGGFIASSILFRFAIVPPIVAGAAASVPFVVLRIKRTKRFRKFEEQFPEALDLMARALKAGHAFATGLKMVADEMEDPVGPEFRKTFDEQNFGLPIKDALANLTERVPLLDVKFFSTAVMIQRDTGGNLAEILENLAMVVRERFKILRQVRVHTAHGRFTGWVLLLLPASLAVVLSFINPEHMNLLFREDIGQMLIAVAVVMQFVGYLWIRQIIKIEV
jgi:tight adherence protein B